MITKAKRLKRRHGKIRKKMTGTAERPRVCIKRSLNNFYAQAVDDMQAKTISSLSTLSKEFVDAKADAGKSNAASKLGELFGNRLKEKGVEKIAFDRGGFKYHGRVKAFAEALRKTGVQF